MDQQCLTHSLAAMRRLHKQVFQINSRAPDECREVMKVKCEPNRLIIEISDNNLGNAPRSEELFAQEVLSCYHLVRQLLIFRQFSNEAEYQRNIVPGSRNDFQGASGIPIHLAIVAVPPDRLTLLDMRNYLDLTGRTALITGASSGIGAASAILFAELGAQVAIGYNANQTGAEQVRDSITQAGGKAIAIRADVRRAEEIQALVKTTTKQLGPIDILVNNAGSLIQRMKIQDLTEERWDEIMDLNLKNPLLCSQAVMPSMIERKRGAIINVVSIAGRNGGGPGAGAYATAKGGFITFTKSLAKELAPHGIRVNGVSPGVIDTPFHEAFSTPDMLRNFVATIPLARMGTSMECATVIAFLASDAASYIVGETIEVNGGQLML